MLLAYASKQAFEAALERAPYGIYRIARVVAIRDANYEIRYGEEEFKGAPWIELYGPDKELHGYITLNSRKEPLVWATTQYKYTFGPMNTFGNLRVPNWATTANGGITYKMVSLIEYNKVPNEALFIPPKKYIQE